MYTKGRYKREEENNSRSHYEKNGAFTSPEPVLIQTTSPLADSLAYQNFSLTSLAELLDDFSLSTFDH
jgi:hypothetical protein